LGFELSIGLVHFVHETFEFDAAIDVVDIADESDGVPGAAGGGETEAVVAEEALDVGNELPLELLMLGWIGWVSHCGRLRLIKRKTAATMHQAQPTIERMA